MRPEPARRSSPRLPALDYAAVDVRGRARRPTTLCVTKPDEGKTASVTKDEAERRRLGRGVRRPAVGDRHEQKRAGEPRAAEVNEQRQLVEVPRLELVVERAGKEDADEVGGEEDGGDLCANRGALCAVSHSSRIGGRGG
jgi:hypothetical protein